MPLKRIKKLDAKALMVIGSLCPISVEGVIRGLRWGIGPEGAKLFHLITYGCSFPMSKVESKSLTKSLGPFL
jgi:hypothetical protein